MQIAVIVVMIARAASICVFPREWRGTWFETRLGEVSITSSNITKKGLCHENQREFYLIENREIGCFLCLSIIRRHDDVLQYRESFCVGNDSMQRICSSIQHESIQHTLVRETPGRSITCPFHDAFHFSYSNNTGGSCHNPMSYVKPCASASQLRFHFRHCPDAAYTYDREMDVECVALWYDGANRYALLRISAKTATSFDDRYRCAMYSVVGSVVYLSLSVDVSCRGLNTPRSGPIVMEFTQDVFGWPKPQCSFPSWVGRTTWRDLSGRHLFRTYPDNTTIQQSFRQSIVSLQKVVKAFRCHSVVGRNSTETQFLVVAFVSDECVARYQCLKIIKRHDGVLELQEGKYMEFPGQPCMESDMLNSNRRTLIADVLSPRPCPLQGRYLIHTGSSLCESYFRIGCSSASTIDLVATCSSAPGFHLECLKTWIEDKKRHLIARAAGDHTGLTNCFSFKRKGSNLVVSVDSVCNAGTTSLLTDTYVLSQRTDCYIDVRFSSAVLGNGDHYKDDHINVTSLNQPDLLAPYKHIRDQTKTRDHRTLFIPTTGGNHSRSTTSIQDSSHILTTLLMGVHLIAMTDVINVQQL